jgi:glycosyltransferase involved in cell wall biosynthesis
MNYPYFSVVIPAYNVQDYIKETIDSILSQSFSDFEILVVNDGSTDNTLEILEAISDPRLRIINQDNGGECRARNRGMAEAIGRYLAFLDADDIWLPYHLQIAYRFFTQHPSAYWFASIPKGFTGKVTDEMLNLPVSAEPQYQLKSYYNGVSILPSSTCILKSAIKEWDLFEPGMKSGGDRIGWLRFCMTSGDSLGIFPDTTVYYRTQRPGAATDLGTSSYNEKFVQVYLNSMTVSSRLMRRYIPTYATKKYLRGENRLHWGWCIRYSLLQGWDHPLEQSEILLGYIIAFPLRLFKVLHTVITALFYSPFYFYSKIQNLK